MRIAISFIRIIVAFLFFGALSACIYYDGEKFGVGPMPEDPCQECGDKLLECQKNGPTAPSGFSCLDEYEHCKAVSCAPQAINSGPLYYNKLTYADGLGFVERRMSEARIEFAAVTTSAKSCKELCAETSPLCSYASAPTGYEAELEQVKNLVLQMPPKVEKSDLMTIFGQTSDPCDREDVIISKGRFENTGSSEVNCVASAEGQLSTGETVKIELALPSRIAGLITQVGGDLDVAVDEGMEPFLRFNEDDQSPYSGPIKRLQTKGSAVVATLGNYCVFIGKTSP